MYAVAFDLMEADTEQHRPNGVTQWASSEGICPSMIIRQSAP